MLGYMRNAGTCKMLYGSGSGLALTLCPCLTCAHTLAVLFGQTSGAGAGAEAEIPGHLLRRRFRCGHCRRLSRVVVVVKLQQAFGLHSIIFEFQQQANK